MRSEKRASHIMVDLINYDSKSEALNIITKAQDALDSGLNFIEVVSPKQAYLTHISHLLGFHSEVEKSLPINVKLAYDNLKISL